jgi:transporter family protein
MAGNAVFFASLAAVFAALTSILAKIGLSKVSSHLATAIRTLVVFVFAWIMVFIVGSIHTVPNVDTKTWVFLILSGITAGGSWLCFFRALQLGSVNRVVPIDKSSTVLTLLLAFIILNEPINVFGITGIVLIALGTWLMIQRQKTEENATQNSGWLVYALAAAFASLTTILGKIGITGIEANLGTAIRTTAIVPMSWVLVFITKEQTGIRDIDRKSWLFLILSGTATGISWLFFYRALQIGSASRVVPIDKLSIVLTMLFARIFLGERFTLRSLAGLALLVIGTVMLIL